MASSKNSKFCSGVKGTESDDETNCERGSSWDGTDTNEPKSESVEAIEAERVCLGIALGRVTPFDGGEVEGEGRGVAGEKSVAKISSLGSSGGAWLSFGRGINGGMDIGGILA